jgi:hypothetical protein
MDPFFIGKQSKPEKKTNLIIENELVINQDELFCKSLDNYNKNSNSGSSSSSSSGNGNDTVCNELNCSSKKKWKCTQCTYENWPSALKCTICLASKVNSIQINVNNHLNQKPKTSILNHNQKTSNNILNNNNNNNNNRNKKMNKIILTTPQMTNNNKKKESTTKNFTYLKNNLNESKVKLKFENLTNNEISNNYNFNNNCEESESSTKQIKIDSNELKTSQIDLPNDIYLIGNLLISNK